MSMERFFKLLPTNGRFTPLTPEESFERAKGTLYEAWFDTMKASPWYKAMWEGHPVFDDPNPNSDGTNRAQKAKELFGDLRSIKFNEWWFETGYRIFAEGVPYMPINILSVRYKTHRKNNARSSNAPRPVESMLIEIPLNLSPSELRRQFNEIIEAHDNYYTRFNRWDHSTADAHFLRDTKLTYFQITHWLKVFAHWEKNKSRKNLYQLHHLCQDMSLAPSLNDGSEACSHMSDEMRHQRMASTAENALKNARNLMAHALFLEFPNYTAHELATNFSSAALKRETARATKPPSHDSNITRQRKKMEANLLKSTD
jgi:hypothetical protein